MGSNVMCDGLGIGIMCRSARWRRVDVVVQYRWQRRIGEGTRGAREMKEEKMD